jgi:hypothetical protein
MSSYVVGGVVQACWFHKQRLITTDRYEVSNLITTASHGGIGSTGQDCKHPGATFRTPISTISVRTSKGSLLKKLNASVRQRTADADDDCQGHEDPAADSDASVPT